MTNLSKTLRFYIFLSAITFAVVSVASTEESDENVPQDIATDGTNLTDREAAINVEIDRRVTELRNEFLNDKSTMLDRWLEIVAIFITFFAIAIPIASFFGYKKFEDIKEEAKEHLDEIRKIKEDVVILRKTAEDHVAGMPGLDNKSTAEVDTSEERSSKSARQISDSVPRLSATVNTSASRHQKDGTIMAANELRQTITKDVEENNPDIAAITWFSVGFLYQFEDPTTTNQLNNHNALDAYTNAIRLNQNHMESYFNRGNVNANLGNHENSISDYNMAIKIQPTAKPASNYESINMLRNLYFNRGNSYTQLGTPNYAKAIDDYNLSLADAANSILNHREIIYYNRGNAKFCVEDYSGAVEDYKATLSGVTFLRSSLFNLGNAEIKLGNYGNALARYDESIKADANYKNAYSNRIVAKVALGLVDESLSDIEQLTQSQSSRTGDDVLSTLIAIGQIIRGNRSRKKLDGDVSAIELPVIGNGGNIGMFGGASPSGDARYLPGGKGFSGGSGFQLRITI